MKFRYVPYYLFAIALIHFAIGWNNPEADLVGLVIPPIAIGLILLIVFNIIQHVAKKDHAPSTK